MNQQDIKLLNKMKRLIRIGHKRFKERKDRDYKYNLYKLFLTEEDVWNHILSLNTNLYFIDPKPNYLKDKNTLVFKKVINKVKGYIKLKIEIINGEEVICWSFHKDGE